MATRHFGNVVAGQMRCLKAEQLPMLLVISRARATNEVIDMIPGLYRGKKHLNKD